MLSYVRDRVLSFESNFSVLIENWDYKVRGREQMNRLIQCCLCTEILSVFIWANFLAATCYCCWCRRRNLWTPTPISPTMLLQVCMGAIYSSSEEVFEAQLSPVYDGMCFGNECVHIARLLQLVESKRAVKRQKLQLCIGTLSVCTTTQNSCMSHQRKC